MSSRILRERARAETGDPPKCDATPRFRVSCLRAYGAAWGGVTTRSRTSYSALHPRGGLAFPPHALASESSRRDTHANDGGGCLSGVHAEFFCDPEPPCLRVPPSVRGDDRAHCLRTPSVPRL